MDAQTMELIKQYRDQIGGRKFSADDVRQFGSIVGPAVADYVQGYSGNFEFMLSMKQQAETRGTLYPGQVAGVLNCMYADIRREEERKVREHAEEMVVDLTKPAESPGQIEVPNGYYTIVFPDKTHVTLRLRQNKMENAPPNSQIVGYLSGSDNTSNYTNFAFVNGRKYRIWNRFRDQTGSFQRQFQALDTLLDKNNDVYDMGRAYAIMSGNCMMCNQLLTDPLSIECSIGPICRLKVDLNILPPRIKMIVKAERRKKNKTPHEIPTTNV